MSHEIAGLTQGFHLLQLSLQFLEGFLRVIHLGIAFQRSTIDAQGQRFDITQIA